MKPIKINQIDTTKTYKIGYLTGKVKEIHYKVNITKVEEPSIKLKEIENNCDEFFNVLLDSNIFELREHYKQWLLDENSRDDNKFIRFRKSINDFYINKNKIHYKILIEIVKIIAYENLTINKMSFQYRYGIINRIFGSEFEKYYHRSECEIHKGEQIW